MNTRKAIGITIITLLFSGLLNLEASVRKQISIDSLKQVIDTASPDSNLIKTYIKIGDYYYHYTNPDSVLYYYRKALKLAGKLEMDNYVAQSLIYLGIEYYYQSDYDSALYYFDKALKVSRKMGDKKNIADILMDIGSVYTKQSIYDKALQYQRSAMKLYEELDDIKGYAGCLNNIGNIYFYQENYKKTLVNYQKSLKIKTEIDDKKGIANLLGNIGYVYFKTGENDKSLESYFKSVKIYKELGDKNGIARIYGNIGEVYVKQKNYAGGLKYYQKALKLYEKTGYKHGIIVTLLNTGDLFNKTGQYNKALDYEFRALKMAMETGELNSQKTAYDHISESYKKAGNYNKALYYKEKWFQVHDSIFSSEKANALAEVEARFQSEKQTQQLKLQQAELEKSKAEIARMEAEKKRQQIQRDLFIVAFVLMIVLAATIFYYYRQKKKDNALLVKQKKEIDTMNEELMANNEELASTLENLLQTRQQLVQSEKMASLGMLSAGIAHEINNPINFVYAGINGLLLDFEDIEPVVKEIGKLNPEDDNLKEKLKKIEQLKAKYNFDEAFEAIPQIISDIKLGANRTAEIVRTLRNFSRMDNGEIQPFDIHEGLDSSLLLLRNKYKNDIEIIKNYAPDIPKINCHPGKINQVFLNILSNAIDAIDGKGKIWITTSREGENIKISVKDTGCGMSEETKQKIFDPFYTTKDAGKGTGLGMSITYDIIQEHKGKIEIISEPGKGTEIIITLPAKITRA